MFVNNCQNCTTAGPCALHVTATLTHGVDLPQLASVASIAQSLDREDWLALADSLEARAKKIADGTHYYWTMAERRQQSEKRDVLRAKAAAIRAAFKEQ